jgi:DNA-binding response OmpR family regulator
VAGAAGYFTKPFSGPAFLEAIANAVRPRAKIGHLTSDP